MIKAFKNLHLEFVLLTVDDDGTDLLIHEYKDGNKKSGYEAGQVHPPRVLSEGHDHPTAVGPSRLHLQRKMERVRKKTSSIKFNADCIVPL